MSNITTDFVKATKKIHADVRAVLTALHLIADDVRAIKEKSGTNGDQNESREENESAGTVCAAENNPGANETKQDTPEELRFRLEKKAYRVGLWTLLILALYTVLTGYQSRQSRNMVELTRKTSEREDRAWVAVQPKGPFRIVAGEELGFPFILVNTGKTPARHIHADMWAKFIPSNSREDLTETGPRLQAECGDLFVNNANIVDVQNPTMIMRQRATIPRSHDTENWPIETSEAQAFDEGGIYAVGYLVVSYDDIFGVHHWTRFCAHYHKTTNPDASKCVAYNSEDDNEEP